MDLIQELILVFANILQYLINVARVFKFDNLIISFLYATRYQFARGRQQVPIRLAR